MIARLFSKLFFKTSMVRDVPHDLALGFLLSALANDRFFQALLA